MLRATLVTGPSEKGRSLLVDDLLDEILDPLSDNLLEPVEAVNRPLDLT